MNEYISKQKVIDYLNGYLHSLGEDGADTLSFDRGQRRALINSIQDISVVKAADVQSVKHGRWIAHGSLPTKQWSCSECKGLVEVSHYCNKCYYDFCPRCGARMDS